MVLFVAGVQKIPTSLYDAARVDGAGAVREFITVTLPGLRYELVVAFVLTTINALRSFDIVYNATKGGPGDETYVPALLMYLNAFKYNEVGYACAIAVTLAVVIFVLATAVNLLADRGDTDARVVLRAHDHLRRAGGVRDRRHLPDPLDRCSWRCTARKTSSRASRCRTASTCTASRGVGPGRLLDRLQVELHRRRDRHDRLGGPLDRHRLRVRHDAFRGDRWVFSLLLLGIIFPYEATVIPLYYDFQERRPD